MRGRTGRTPPRGAGAGPGRDAARDAQNHGKIGPTRAIDPPLYRRALVVFSGRSGLRCLACLKPGFRHCFAALDDGAAWLTVDSLLHRLEIRATGLPSAFDLAAEYRRLGLDVVETEPRAVPLRRAPLAPFTCVETVKRLIGVRARRVITPWQLYRFLVGRAAAAGDSAATPGREQNRKILLTAPGHVCKNKSIE